jgi:transposase InsO family protein
MTTPGFVVIATVVTEPSGRAVCEAFVAALARYGVSSEVLTDNGKQFTGRFAKPYPAEVLFERICRENGITTRLTKPRSPTTTGNIERWHKTLRRELLDAAGPFPSVVPTCTARTRTGSSRALRAIDSDGDRCRCPTMETDGIACTRGGVGRKRHPRRGVGDHPDRPRPAVVAGRSAGQVHCRPGTPAGDGVGQRPQHPRRP